MKNKRLIILSVLSVFFASFPFTLSLLEKDINLKLDIEKKEKKKEKVIKKDFKIELEKSKCNAKWKTIYEYADGKKIKSKCGEVYYLDENSNKVTLREALDKEYINIADITNNMEVIWATFDGGSTLYGFDKETSTISENGFNLEVCRAISGNKNIFFISTKDKEYYCN